MPKDQEIIHIQELLMSDGWKIVENRLDMIIADIENKLFGDDDEITSTEMLEKEEYELLRKQRRHLIELKNIPNQIIFESNFNEDNVIEDYDPYSNL